MAYQHDTEFHDEDLPKALPISALSKGGALVGKSAASLAPSVEELTAEVTDRAQQLIALRERQAQIERAKAELEELRRKRSEFDTGKGEMRDRLIRSVALLEQSELAARRQADQMAKSLNGLRDAATAVQKLSDQAWSSENWHRDLTRDLAVLENARNEMNSATQAWPILEGNADSKSGRGGKAPAGPATLDAMSFGQLARLGLALSWPLMVLGMAGFGMLLFLLLRK